MMSFKASKPFAKLLAKRARRKGACGGLLHG